MNDYDELQSDLRANPRKWLVTGVAGFIGSHLLEELLKLEQVVVDWLRQALGLPAARESGAVVPISLP